MFFNIKGETLEIVRSILVELPVANLIRWRDIYELFHRHRSCIYVMVKWTTKSDSCTVLDIWQIMTIRIHVWIVVNLYNRIVDFVISVMLIENWQLITLPHKSRKCTIQACISIARIMSYDIKMRYIVMHKAFCGNNLIMCTYSLVNDCIIYRHWRQVLQHISNQLKFGTTD